MVKEQIVYDVEGEITIRNSGWRNEVDLVLTDTRVSVYGRKKRAIVVRLTKEQWRMLAQVIPEQEHRRYILETADAEMADHHKRQADDATEHRLDLIHKLGLDDTPNEELPYCLRKR